MITKKGFHLRNVCGEYVIVAEGLENIDFSKIISMNESAAFLWNKVDGKGPFNIDDLASYLCEDYDVDYDTAKRDAKDIVEKWFEAGIIEQQELVLA